MAKVRCWHCDAENDPVTTGGFCDACGRKLPTERDEGIADSPRRRDDPDDPRDDRTRRDYDRDRDDLDLRRRGGSSEARNALNQTSGGLFAVAVLQMVCGTVVLLAAPAALGIPQDALVFVFAVAFGLGVLFVGLGIWSRFQPLPPAIIGLILYVIVFLIDLVAAVQAGSMNIGFAIRIVIIVALGKGIQSAIKYNQLQSSQDYD